MTIPTQPSQGDRRRPSVSTSSLPNVGPPFGHRLPTLTQHTPTYRTVSPPYQSMYAPYLASPTATATAAIGGPTTGGGGGLVTANHKQDNSPSSPTNAYRPLNVIDALAYLDKVKGQFTDKPNVYNQFLDIMKDFKSQSIDTPGVIDRVSSLFKGHPLLISGFNTFLPAGYRIECSIDPRDPNRIIVTTPNGHTTTSTTTTAEEMLKINTPSYHSPYYPPYYSSIIPPPPPPQASSPPPPPPPQTSLAPPPITSPPASSSKPPVEFNHAINYVNRIKNRFAHNPGIYKQFLEILQTYQKEQKPISEVYSHVQYLFQGSRDLLEEFKQFLPEMALIAEDEKPLVKKTSSATLMTSKKKQSQQSQQQPQHQPQPQPQQQGSFDPTKPSVSLQETDLFDRIKKHIGTKPSYEEFLKTLNLYTQQIVDLDTLMIQLKPFLGSDQELFAAFQSAVGYTPVSFSIEKPTTFAPKPDLLTCKKVASSASYRQVPKDWQNQPCSGRDQMCWEVLNDEYASHPIWNSEDSGFVASKKNSYEEALHRCEEERYEYDLNIEANLNTIALMEPIALEIESMTTEQQALFRLTPGLGGETVSIYERMIKKVYDHDRGTEIIQMLYTKPATVLPVLLKRLKMKDREWKKAQRDWNKIWRELDAKNFYRSLDYQGTSFKSNDKKAFVNKTLIGEIQEQQQQVFTFTDEQIVHDISRCIFSFIEHQTGFAKSDKQKIRIFLRTFLPNFFYTSEESLDVDMDGVSSSSSSSEEEEGESSDSGPALHLVKLDMHEQLDLFSVGKKPSIFFCHSHYYCLIRLYQLLYDRLARMKALNVQSDTKLQGKNKTALELDLYTNRFEDMDLSKGSYAALLDTIEHLFEGEIDSATFEEAVRYLFGIEAYTMFTVDKVVQALIKGIQTVLSDKKSIQLAHLFRQYINGHQPLSVYRNMAEDILLGGSDDTLFKINLVSF
ncbi:uncharacterized protein EV154DRAFT_514399 [Mucor mucedo]|uniref:uncharacterized protein n=1 Tax=Mucor mucedo TaxID=29922 RepID=UPI00221E4B6F|nr:uncharacterized protein EV154DRAFT_514399 [Mucor mucedo]KAI7889487.1 hypothetical protein EV154DRAFT_514399 [Mucor mucedo]